MADILKISIGESDGIIQPDGIPTMVILTIKTADGKEIRLPYKAKNTVAQMCVDAAKAGDSAGEIAPERAADTTPAPSRLPSKNDIIQANDLVRCVSTGHKAGINELKTGNIYQILNPTETGFDVVSVDADIKTRIPATIKDFELYQKFSKGTKNQPIMERTFDCPNCKQEASLLFSKKESYGICDCGLPTEKKSYSGECQDCGNKFQKEVIECSNDPEVCKRLVKKNA